MTGRAVPAVVGRAVLAGAAFGVLTSLVNNGSDELGLGAGLPGWAREALRVLSLVVGLAPGWAAFAFVVGWWAGHRLRAWAAGVVAAGATVAAVVAYYVCDAVVLGGPGRIVAGVAGSRGEVLLWSALAVAGGVPLGALGALAAAGRGRRARMGS